jgi:hypothetical protein
MSQSATNVSAEERNKQIAIAIKFFEDLLMLKIPKKEKFAYLIEKGIKLEDIETAYEKYEKRQQLFAMDKRRQEELKQARDQYER